MATQVRAKSSVKLQTEKFNLDFSFVPGTKLSSVAANLVDILYDNDEHHPLYCLTRHLKRQIEFSTNAFGPGDRAKAVVDHIRKELREVEANPSDLEEWIDVAMLALDGAWRAGYSPEQVSKALESKLTKNENRNWPDWRTADPDKAIEHVREGE